MDFTKILPNEIQFKIFEKLTPKELMQLILVNKELYILCKDNFIWKCKFIQEFGNYYICHIHIYYEKYIYFSNISSRFVRFLMNKYFQVYHMNDILIFDNLYKLLTSFMKNFYNSYPVLWDYKDLASSSKSLTEKIKNELLILYDELSILEFNAIYNDIIRFMIGL
jgi:hypothetical protein